jgi:type IV secretion system protein VirB1
MMALADFYAACGPWVHPDTIAAIVAVESSGHPWAIGTPHGAYFARTRAEATRVLARVLRSESSVDIGLMQINSQWIGRLHVSPEQLLDPCFNVRIGAAILAENFVGAARPGRTLLETLAAALSRFNSGSETGAVSYAAKVLSVRARSDRSPAGANDAR